MITLQPSNESVSKKRKWDQDKHEKPAGPIKPDILDQNQTQKTLLPGWQRCLDIKSGKAYLYNARTTTAPMASRNNPLSSSSSANSYNDPRPMSLELKLNLPHQSTSTVKKGIVKSPSWLSLEGDQQQEMVAAVCQKCYMLVMMSKSLRSCPNCKFVHPLEPVQTFLFQG